MYFDSTSCTSLDNLMRECPWFNYKWDNGLTGAANDVATWQDCAAACRAESGCTVRILMRLCASRMKKFLYRMDEFYRVEAFCLKMWSFFSLLILSSLTPFPVLDAFNCSGSPGTLTARPPRAIARSSAATAPRSSKSSSPYQGCRLVVRNR